MNLTFLFCNYALTEFALGRKRSSVNHKVTSTAGIPTDTSPTATTSVSTTDLASTAAHATATCTTDSVAASDAEIIITAAANGMYPLLQSFQLPLFYYLLI